MNIEDPRIRAIYRLRFENSKTWEEVGRTLNESSEAVRSAWRRWKAKHPNIHVTSTPVDLVDQIILSLKRGPKKLSDLSEILDKSESSVLAILGDMRDAGYGITQEDEAVTLPTTPSVDFETSPLFEEGKAVDVCFGVVGDTHGGSKYEQITALQDFVHIAQEEYGVRHILHTGDSFAGKGVYKGQSVDVYAVGGNDQAEVVVNNLPKSSDLTWFMLGGNHCYSFYRVSGMDVRVLLSAKGRDDIILLSYDVEDVPLLPGIDARLWHPSGGPAYALSYRGQKYVEQLSLDELSSVVTGEKAGPTVRLVLIGHFHKSFSFRQGPIQVIGTGCFEAQNSYLKRKGLIPDICAHILKCRFVDGILHRLEDIEISYRAIENDWRAHWVKRQPKREEIRIVPIFSLEES